MQSRLRTDQIMSNMHTQIGNYNVDKVQRIPFDKKNIEVGAFQAVKHIRENYIDDETELLGIGKLLNKRDPVSYETYGVQGNDRGAFEYSTMEQLPETMYTKKNKKAQTINRFETLHINPQNISNIIMNEPHRGGFHTRNFEKDSYANKC